ncbi:hypothetical protein QE152_g30923 [Popillia japonica]|uniref:Uncharacterized protein n=1 Tax=Popillia japonica TaxID=7064 RepID=A0AAW1JD51_POPJA
MIMKIFLQFYFKLCRCSCSFYICGDESVKQMVIEQQKYKTRYDRNRYKSVKQMVIEQQKYKTRYDRNRYKNVEYVVGEIVFMKAATTATGESTKLQRKCRGPVEYVVGEIVFMKAATTATGESTKLQRKCRGPLAITKVLPEDTYGVADLRDDLGKRYITTAHVSQLKVWKTNTEDEGFEGESFVSSCVDSDALDGEIWSRKHIACIFRGHCRFSNMF